MGEGLGIAFDTAPVPSWIVNLDTLDFLQVNGAAVQRYGFLRETFLSSNLTLLRPNDDLDTIRADYTLFATHPDQWFERKHRLANGDWLGVSVQLKPIPYDGVTAALVWVKDNSLEEQYIRAAVDNAARFSDILRASLDAIVLINRDSKVTGWSGEAAHIFGWSEEEAVGASMPELIIPERFRSRHYEGLASYIVTGRSKILDKVLDLSAIRQSGDEFPIRMRIQRLSKRSLEFVAYIRDLSEGE